MKHYELEPKPNIVTEANAVARLALADMQRVPNSHIGEFRTSGDADCLGYTIASSEALENDGINHRVAYVNAHATILLPTSSEVWLLDLFSPAVQQRIDDKLHMYISRTDAVQVGRLDRVAMLHALPASISLDRALATYPWLRSPRDSRNDYASFVDTIDRDPTLVMSVYEPEKGRTMLHSYGTLQAALRDKDIEAAGHALVALGDQYPEHDMRSRSNREVVKKIIKPLTVAGDTELATAATEAFFSGFNAIHDGRVSEYKADCLRYIAKASSQPTLARRALELYQHAYQQPGSFKRSISSKLIQCEKLV